MDFPESTKRILRSMVRKELGRAEPQIKKTSDRYMHESVIEVSVKKNSDTQIGSLIDFQRLASDHAANAITVEQKRARRHMFTMAVAISIAILAITNQNRPIDLSLENPLEQSVQYKVFGATFNMSAEDQRRFTAINGKEEQEKIQRLFNGVDTDKSKV